MDKAEESQENDITGTEGLLKELALGIVRRYVVGNQTDESLMMVRDAKYVCILDSSYLFQAGAYSPLLSTIEAVNDIVPEMVIIMLWDQNMTLFPELFRR